MRFLATAAFAIFALCAEGAEVITVSSWEFHSSFWMSLHQTLMAEASSPSPTKLAELSAEEHALWNETLKAYREAGGDRDMTFTRPMMITNDALTQVTDDASEPLIDAPLADALNRAAPVYRRHWWPADDAANRFFISYAAPLLRESAKDLVSAHERVYRMTWPKKIRVYISLHAGRFGAYTMTGRAGGVITTMSSRDEGYQGLRSLEMLLHEGSHGIVYPTEGTIGETISNAAKKHGIEAPGNLWHALLFATSGELTRSFLASRGVSNYVASSDDMWTRVWPEYREAIQKYWLPYVNGQGTLEGAIDKVVAAIPRSR